MKVAKLTIKDGDHESTVCHHPGINQPWDISLCGQDLMGDRIGTEKWGCAVEVDGKIDCQMFVAIILTCKELRKSDFIAQSKQSTP